MARMNLAEMAFINSTLRVRELRRTIGPRVLDRADPGGVSAVLEVGCGQGVGLQLLLERFPRARLVGVDLDARMILRARRLLAPVGDQVELRVGDLSSLPDGDGSFDVVVDFAAVHHVPDWQGALSEIARVLRPGGQFLFEDHDVTKHSWLARHLFAHPEERFTAAEFVGALTHVGIAAGDDIDDRNGHFVGRGIRDAP
jgi:ubiquinone/menaquinone biosynthesis C-methylase UbiE